MLKFSKLHGNGNDYVFMEEITGKLPPLEALARFVSNRNFAVGSDGLIVAAPSDKADFKMLMYNADGSRGKMCGNGIRALAKYAYDNGLINKLNMEIETDAGIKQIELDYDKKDSSLAYARVDMGEPEFQPAKIPVAIKGNEAAAYEVKEKGFSFLINILSMGNPHCVTFLDESVDEFKSCFLKKRITHEELDFFNSTKKLGELNYFDIESFGKLVQGLEIFTEGVNVEIAKIIDRDNIAMRVYERGSAETLSCGTGCCAVAVAAIKKRLVNNVVNVHSLGGSLEISWNEGKELSVFMKGSARTVYEGNLIFKN